ncbi:MAG: hypothetical protein IJK18_03090 [Clostridia bacterium]|nr:hypothetical protein [Clostridia bacterium]
MANNEKNYRASCNEVNCAKSELGMPQEGKAITFGDNEIKIVTTNSGTRGIVPEEIALGKRIEAVGYITQEPPQNSKETR